MRQYGAVRGNVFDSDADWLAEKARAIELRLAEKIIEEQLESRFHPAELRLAKCEDGECEFPGCNGCWKFLPSGEQEYWDTYLECMVSNRLTYRLQVSPCLGPSTALNTLSPADDISD